MDNNQYPAKPIWIIIFTFVMMIASLTWGAMSGHETIFNLTFFSLFFSLMLFLVFTNYQHKLETIFYIIIAGFSLYYIFFIIIASTVINGVRYFSLFEDTMISMRYAKNFADGYGLIWNPGGDRVEGFTNLLWVLYMAFWHLFPLGAAKVSLPIQITGLLFFIASLFLVRKISDHIFEGNRYIAIGAVLLTASYQPLYYWALKGMETSIAGFIVLLAVWRVLVCLKHKSFDPLLFVLLGTNILIRFDTVALYIAFSLFLIIAQAENRYKHIGVSALFFIIMVGGLSLFRWFYYGDIFPNVYYLKVAGVPLLFRIVKGVEATNSFIKNLSYFLFIVVLVYSFMHIKNNNKIKFLLCLISTQLLYSIYVGGDTWEEWGGANRFLCIVIPLFFILLSSAIYHLIQTFASFSGIAAGLKKLCYVVLLLIAVLQLHSRPENNPFKVLVRFPGYEIELDKQYIRAGLLLRDITYPGAKIAGPGGAIAYFSDRYFVDLLGKCDRYLAHQKAKVQISGEYSPGHYNWDYAYSLNTYTPDIVTYISKYCLDTQKIRQYFIEHYVRFEIQDSKTHKEKIYCLKSSPNINWSVGSIIELPSWLLVDSKS